MSQVYFVGTKSDLRQVETGALKKSDGEWLKQVIKADKLVECSSKFMHNVELVFQEALLTHVQHNEVFTKKPKRKTTCVLL